MLLQRLVEHSNQQYALPSLYAEGPLRYLINLDQEGRFFPPLTDMGDSSRPLTRRGQRRLLPQVQRSSSIRPLLLADKADYTLGYVADEKRANRAQECHQAYVQLVERCAAETGDADVLAILDFLRHDPLDQVNPDHSFDPTGIITFKVGGRVTIDKPAVQAFWASANTGPSEPSQTMQCLVCGNTRPVLDRLQTKIKGIPGGQTAGTSMISANSGAFESYGLQASRVAPTCASCGKGIARGLNALLSGEQSRFIAGNGVSVVWTRGEPEFNLLAALDDPDPTQVHALMETVRAGQWTDMDDRPFYALSLSATGGRAVVRDWLDTTVRSAKEHLATWFQRQHIIPWSGGAPRYYGVRALSLATVREARDLSITTPGTLIRAAFTDTTLPRDILCQAVRRNHAEQEVNRLRAALIKLALLSRDGGTEENFMVQLDPTNAEPGYLCGRLLAVLEGAQRAVTDNLNTTFVDRLYGAASTSPQPAFGRLLSVARTHLATLEKHDRDAYDAIQIQLEEVMSRLATFPKTLTLEQQGFFSLGYYHQRAHDRARSRAQPQGRQGQGDR